MQRNNIYFRDLTHEMKISQTFHWGQGPGRQQGKLAMITTQILELFQKRKLIY